MRKSFSIIELIITLAIIFIICGISINWYALSQEDILNNELSTLKQTLLMLQYKAVSSGKIEKIFINEEKNAYFYYINNKKKEHFLHKLTSFGFLKKTKGPPGNPKSLVKKAITFDLDAQNDGITLYPDGTTDAGTFYLITANMQKMGALTCGVSQVFYIGRYTYSKGVWVLYDK